MMTSALTSVVPPDTDRLPCCTDEQRVSLANGSSSVVGGRSARQQLQQDMQQALGTNFEAHCTARLLLLELWGMLMLVLKVACGMEWLM